MSYLLYLLTYLFLGKCMRTYNTWHNTHTTILWHYTGQPVSSDTSSYELEDFVAAKFYCLHTQLSHLEKGKDARVLAIPYKNTCINRSKTNLEGLVVLVNLIHRYFLVDREVQTDLMDRPAQLDLQQYNTHFTLFFVDQFSMNTVIH